MNGLFAYGQKSLVAASALCLLAFGQTSSAIGAEATPIIISPEHAVGAFQESAISAEPVALHFEDPRLSRVGKLSFLGSLELKSEDSRFGGLSSLQLSADGSQFLAISDRGYWVGGILDHQGDRMTGLRNVVIAPLLDLNGSPLIEVSKEAGDAEAIAEIPGSGIIVSFEGRDARLWHYGVSMTDYARPVTPRPLPLPLDVVKEIRALPWNGGIEAMTSLPGGTLVAIAEDSNRSDDLLDGWIISSSQIARFKYRMTENFRPTDLATLPDGNLILLERRFSLLKGLAARIRTIKAEDLLNGGPIEGEEIATLAFPFNVDNMEGIAVRENERGDTLIYLVSDDNYHPLQRTLLMSFKLEDEYYFGDERQLARAGDEEETAAPEKP